MNKLDLLLEQYTGTAISAPVALGVRSVYSTNIECGAAGNFGNECSSPNCDDDRDYEEGDCD